MKIAIISHYRLPIKKYGGTQRVIYANAEALTKLGHTVYLVSLKGTVGEGFEVIPTPQKVSDYNPYIPDDTDIVHIQYTPEVPFEKPFLVTINGNCTPEEKFFPNTVFVSRNHAERHGSDRFVYNGIETSEYIYREEKDTYFLFLSKVSRKEKGLSIALELARRNDLELKVAGGWRPGLRRKVSYTGMVGGRKKAELLAGARALLFPIQWEEPFGLVVTEALVSGTPVITTNRGAMPELVPEGVGFRCDTIDEMSDAIQKVDSISPEKCREWVLDNFTAEHMAKAHLEVYEEIIAEGNKYRNRKNE